MKATPLLYAVLMTASSATAQDAAPTGERWRVESLYERVGARDSAPSRRERRRDDICLKTGTANFDKELVADIPAKLKGKCWIKDQREEGMRKQIKYQCNDGSSVEGVTRRDSATQWGSQVVINISGQGGMSITREMTRLPGTCDPTAPRPAPAGPPAVPATPAATGTKQ
jgi:hypothetical protein